MKKNFQIAIPKPCHEKWGSFAKTASGGFCTSCQKEVIDFTTWDEERLKQYFKSGGSACGRFRPQQLKVYTYHDSKTRRYGWLPVFFAGGLLFFSSRQAVGQQRVDFAHHPTEQYPHNDSTERRAMVPSVLRVTGVVISPEDSMSLPGVNVVLKGTTQSTNTDGDGRFSITLTNPRAASVLVFSFIGFTTIAYPLSTDKADQEIRIELLLDKQALEENIIVGGCYVVRWYNPRTWWWKIKSLF